jgi:peptide-methionine (S)-S-oxide reductase
MVMQKGPVITETIYLAGGCLWGVQEFVRHLPGVIQTEAGRANGTSSSTKGEYDGYAECVRTVFDPAKVSVSQLVEYLFEIIDPYSINRQGPDVGEKYRTGVYSKSDTHLNEAKEWIASREDAERIVVEVLSLTHYVRSDEEHQNRLTRCPEDTCHLPRELLHKYKRCS